MANTIAKALKKAVGTDYATKDIKAATSTSGATDVIFRDGGKWMVSTMSDKKIPRSAGFSLSFSADNNDLPGSGLIDW